MTTGQIVTHGLARTGDWRDVRCECGREFETLRGWDQHHHKAERKQEQDGPRTRLARQRVEIASQARAQATHDGIVHEMRAWIEECNWADLDRDQIQRLPEATVLSGVDRHYAGGIEQFVADCG